jgi:hypothetical protein
VREPRGGNECGAQDVARQLLRSGRSSPPRVTADFAAAPAASSSMSAAPAPEPAPVALRRHRPRGALASSVTEPEPQKPPSVSQVYVRLSPFADGTGGCSGGGAGLVQAQGRRQRRRLGPIAPEARRSLTRHSPPCPLVPSPWVRSPPPRAEFKRISHCPERSAPARLVVHLFDLDLLNLAPCRDKPRRQRPWNEGHQDDWRYRRGARDLLGSHALPQAA